METALAGIRLESYLPEGGPGWVNVTEDLIAGVKAAWGIHGASPKDRVGSVGVLASQFDNSENNSAGLEGYYLPGHPNCREGFQIGTPVRLVLSHPLRGDVVKWVGTVKAPIPGVGIRNPKTALSCVDWMEEAGRARPSGLPVMVDTQADEVFEALLSSIEKQPPGGAVTSAGSDLYPFALDNMQDESSNLTSELLKLCMSEFGYSYVKAGRLVFEGRSVRASGGSVLFALDDGPNGILTGIGVTHDRDDVLNRVQVSVHPRRRDAAATTVLFTLGSSQRIERNTSITINAPYRDPNQQAQRVGGMDIVDPPVAGTDYTFNAAEDGSGADLTAQLSFDVDPGGNSAAVVTTNNGPFDGYIPKEEFQLRGRGLYDFEPIISDVRDAASAAAHGQNDFSFDMPYQSSASIAADTAQFILALNKDPRTRITSVTFWANWDEETLLQVFDRDISDKISVTSERLGIAGVFYINGVSLDITRAGAIKVTYDVAPADTSSFWTLEVDGMTELDETTVLGYGLFVARWLLDADTLGPGGGSFLN